MALNAKQVSSLEKITPLSKNLPELKNKITVLKGESFSYQIAIESSNNTQLYTEIVSPIKDYIKLYSVKNAVLDFAIYTDLDDFFQKPDDDLVTKEPGLMPDILMPIEYENNLVRLSNEAVALWVTVNIPKDIECGEYPVTVKLIYSDPFVKNSESDLVVEQTMYFDVINEIIPDQKTIFTQWFHVDCIADIHNVTIYSEEHWDLIDKYMGMANKLGINMILTPVITPPLDTGVGSTRPCTQLVKIEKKNEKYIFDFTLLKRWIQLVDKNNIKYFEICQLFSQWGLKYAPNIKVTENGIESYMFGWHTDAKDPEYKNFLNQFVPAIMEFCKTEGIKDRLFFHISDEPKVEHVDAYNYAYNIIKPLIEDCPTMDAISNYDFYEKGLISDPVTGSDHIEPFFENKSKNQWVYYCCSQYVEVGNRFMAMPSYRNRILGLQIYKYNIKGFLHWGYNFYYNQHSLKQINPYITTSCDKAFPSGDPFSVYPVINDVVPSLRAVIFKEALNDVEICRTLEKYIGREKVVEMIDNAAGMNLTFAKYPRNNEFIPSLIDDMKEIIKKYN